MKEYLHLFEKVENSGPKENGRYFCEVQQDSKTTVFMSVEFKFGWCANVVRWLDLSKLTTKAKAFEALEDLQFNEDSFSTMPSADVAITDAAIQKFKSEL